MVVNIVGAPPLVEGEVLWLVEDDYPVNVGDAFDHRDSRYDEINIGLARLAERHEFIVRALLRTIRRLGAAGNTAAMPMSVTIANVPDLNTETEFREFAKTVIHELKLMDMFNIPEGGRATVKVFFSTEYHAVSTPTS